ncbi:hypothetical protein [Microbulbifer sp. JMSA003]|uniref:hypothetical protein n=1 Tax=Microbulbifer sp. JMSA003 TaxID=3243369 RepID=UPI0040398768
MDREEVYKSWGLPSIKIGSGDLIAREHAAKALELIYENQYYFLGYDAFTVFPNGKRQPHMEFGASFRKERQPSLIEAINLLKLDPKEITHYEFVFEQHA